MKIDVMENGLFNIKELLKPFVLENSEGTQLAIAMKDDGYELLIGGIWYKANEYGIVSMKQIDDDTKNKCVLDSMKVAFSLDGIKPRY